MANKRIVPAYTAWTPEQRALIAEFKTLSTRGRCMPPYPDQRFAEQLAALQHAVMGYNSTHESACECLHCAYATWVLERTWDAGGKARFDAYTDRYFRDFDALADHTAPGDR